MRNADIPLHLHDRYGVRPVPLWQKVAAIAAVVVAVPTLVYAASRYVASQQRPFALIRWSASDSNVDVTWRLDPRAEPIWCAIRAQDFEHFDVGFAVVPVAAGAEEATYALRVTTRPIAVDVIACEADPYVIPGAQFRPGELPPAQADPGRAPGVVDPAELS